MKALPERRLESCKRERVKVDSGSLIHVDRNVYSVPSRLIGEQVEARLYMDQVEVWYGQKKVERDAAPAGAAQASRGLSPHHRLAGAQAGGLRALPLPRRVVSDQPVPHGLRCAAGAARPDQGSKEYLEISGVGGQGERGEGGGGVARAAGSRRPSVTAPSEIEACWADEHGPTMRDVKVAAVDLERFDELYRAPGRCCNERNPTDRNGVDGAPERTAPAGDAACFEETAQQAEKETLSYEQYLLELTERECEERRRNRIATLLRESGLPLEKTLANFDLKRLPAKVARQ